MKNTSNLKARLMIVTLFAVGMLVALMLAGQKSSADPKKGALQVQSQAAQGQAAPGNSQPANFLVLVTDPDTGTAVTDLVQADFKIINHFAVTGQTCGFSNNIVGFANVGTGAYQIRVGLVVPGCTWVAGDYLAQVMVARGSEAGQAAVTLSVE
ncbi:MAG TPA: hypothetical protein VFF31_14510 [Blastocatellia bacterium]|nr:hypothetical protein [Blastocatellia bacterium]